MSLLEHISQHITQVTGESFQPQQQQSTGGGCINQTITLSDGTRRYFAKINSASFGDMFEAEADALTEMADTHTVRVPLPVCHGNDGEQCYLVMEHLEMHGRADMRLLGRQLAAMHRVTANIFGWRRDNTIGSTPQPNQLDEDWFNFWRDQRLGFQLQLAARNGYGGELQSLGEKLMEVFPALFENHSPQPSLLHGDLWGGNAAGLDDGTPVIFDPALYYGDREADLAMTHLFGGFNADFYATYREAWPLDDGHAERRTFYNLYHIINHLNLFGGGYHSQAMSMIQSLLSSLR